MKTRMSTKYMVVTAIMGALSFIIMLFEISMPSIIPEFVKFDFSDLPALITSFAYGPLYGVLVCLLKNLIHLAKGETIGIGELANFLLGAAFVLTAGTIYKFNKTFKGAIIATVVGSFVMAAVSLPVNYFVIYPLYSNVLHFPIPAIVGMYTAILPSADTLFKALLIFNVPFTFVKGLADSIICFLVYKKLSPILKSNK